MFLSKDVSDCFTYWSTAQRAHFSFLDFCSCPPYPLAGFQPLPRSLQAYQQFGDLCHIYFIIFLQSFRTHHMECMKTTGLKVLVYVDLCPWAICNDYSFSQGGPVHCLSEWEAGMRWKPERHLAQCPCRKWQWFLSYCCGLTEPTNFQPSIWFQKSEHGSLWGSRCFEVARHLEVVVQGNTYTLTVCLRQSLCLLYYVLPLLLTSTLCCVRMCVPGARGHLS